ncbi:hypothetical protein D3C87_1689670 [compost metagenome]
MKHHLKNFCELKIMSRVGVNLADDLGLRWKFTRPLQIFLEVIEQPLIGIEFGLQILLNNIAIIKTDSIEQS